MSQIQPLSGLGEIAGRYEAFIVDLWGVLHDGVTAFPEALAALRALRASGKPIIILSNAPRRATLVVARNAELGIPEALADLVMSSGEATWRHLSERNDPWYARLGGSCYHLGPARDLGIRDGLDLAFVDDLQAADFLLVTGILDNSDRIEKYDALLDAALARGLPLICANPDLEVIRGGTRELCAGSVAQRYENRGGQVRFHGKPDAAIYVDCLEALGLEAGPGILTIGDSLRTDVAGARAAGLSALFVVGGIHAEALGMAGTDSFDSGELHRLCDERGVFPDAAISQLRW